MAGRDVSWSTMHLLRRLPGLRRPETSTHAPGAVIPLRPGSTDVPQGLGYDAEHEEFVYTFYDLGAPDVGSLVFADAEGGVTARVPLSGLDHYGGVTLHAGRTYVCGAGKVQVHDTAVLRQGIAEPLATVPVRASSTVTSHHDGLYVARFRRERPERMYRYDLDAVGTPVETGAVFTVPPRTQGVAFAQDGTAYFSRSWGRACPRSSPGWRRRTSTRTGVGRRRTAGTPRCPRWRRARSSSTGASTSSTSRAPCPIGVTGVRTCSGRCCRGRWCRASV